MTKRERLEDLGVLLEKLQSLMDHELFEIFDKLGCRRKDFIEHIDALPEEKRDDILHSIAYGIDSVQSLIGDCWAIARGEDEE
jgi:hypothetical protein